MKESAILDRQFRERGYPQEIVTRAKLRATSIPREQLFDTQSKTPTNRLCWGIEYSPRSYQMKRIIEKHWHLLCDIPGCSLPPMVGFRKTKTLRSKLIRTDLVVNRQIKSSLPSGHFKCGHCKICKMAREGKVVQVNNTKITLKAFTTCATEGIVYLWRCPCSKYYVGKTTRCLHTRLQEHMSRIRLKNTEAPLADHYISMSHCEDEFRFTVLYTGTSTGSSLDLELHKSEAYWINKLNSLQPGGAEFGHGLKLLSIIYFHTETCL